MVEYNLESQLEGIVAKVPNRRFYFSALLFSCLLYAAKPFWGSLSPLYDTSTISTSLTIQPDQTSAKTDNFDVFVRRSHYLYLSMLGISLPETPDHTFCTPAQHPSLWLSVPSKILCQVPPPKVHQSISSLRKTEVICLAQSLSQSNQYICYLCSFCQPFLE